MCWKVTGNRTVPSTAFCTLGEAQASLRAFECSASPLTSVSGSNCAMLVPRVCSIVSVHIRGGVQPFSLLHRCISSELERWQRRCDRLTQLQRRIRLPPLRVLAVDGEDIELPLPAAEPVRTPGQEELEYLMGFFDGDGCVTMRKQTRKVELSIGQNVDSANVLLHFRSLLGGSISRLAASTGSQKAKVQWRVCGSKMSASS